MASRSQSKQEQRYWSVVKSAPYYTYYADKKTGYPIEELNPCVEYQQALDDQSDPWHFRPDAVIRIGKFTPTQIDDILSFSKRDLYGSDWIKHRWEWEKAYLNVGDSLLVGKFVLGIIQSNWRKKAQSAHNKKRR